MRGINLPQQKCRGALLMELAQQIKDLKEELDESKSIMYTSGMYEFKCR